METTITESTKIFYTAKTHTTGGRDHGVSRSSDGHLDITLSVPGTDGTGQILNNYLLPVGQHVLKEQWVSLHVKDE